MDEQRASPPAAGIFVGRREEMRQLTAALDEAIAGRGHVVLLAGEPGIGKTRTAQEFVAVARHRDAEVLVGRCHEGEGAPAYWPWIQIVRAYLLPRDGTVLSTDMGPGAADIAEVVPDVRERLPGLPPAAPLEPAQARFRLFDSMTGFLRRAASRRPLVLVIDDLHCADAPSLLLLQFLARESAESALLAVGTYRDTEVGALMADTLAELARQPHVHRVQLHGLGEEDVGRLVEALSGARLSPPLAARLHEQTEGNPFFVGEVVRLLASDGRLEELVVRPSGQFTLPRGLHAVIGRRLARLPKDCKRVLTTAAAIGREFDLSILGRVSDLPRNRLLEAVAQAADAHAITGVDGAVGRFRFTHALIRESLYESLNAIHRIGLHGRIGHALEELCGTDREPHLTELAHHFFQAAPGDPERAIDYAVAAARRSIALLAYEEAARHYQRALDVVESAAPADPDRRCELSLALGDALTRAGNAEQARRAFEQAADIARRRHGGEQLARAALGWGAWVDPLDVEERLIALLEEALGALGHADNPLRSRVLARLARALYGTDRRERRAQLSEEALALASRLGDAATLTFVLGEKRRALWSPDNLDERIADATMMLRLAEETGEREMALAAHMYRVIDLLESGDIAGVDREIAAQARLATELREPAYLHYATVFRTTRALLDGRFDEAERLAEQALAMGTRTQDPTATQIYGAHIAQVRWARGRLDDLEEPIRGFVALYPAYAIWRCALAWLYSELEREPDARREFELLAAGGFTALPRDFTWLASVALLTEVCAFLQDAPRAAILHGLLIPFAGLNVVGSWVTCLGSASHYLGRLAATRSRWEEAGQHFEDALGVNARMGARPFVARTQHAYATMLLSRDGAGDRDKAHDLLERARVCAAQLGMVRLGEKLLAAEDGIRPRVPKHGSWENVFRREGDFWTIAYGGVLVRLRDSAGLNYLAHLLRHPGEEVLALDLLASLRGRHPARGTPSDAGNLLDAQAKTAYRRRLDDLTTQRDEAEAFNDPERAARAQGEIDALARELARGVGLGGRDRKAGAPVERARVSVTRTIRHALRHIAAQHKALGRHLAATIRTGTYCAYVPDPSAPVSWME